MMVGLPTTRRSTASSSTAQSRSGSGSRCSTACRVMRSSTCRSITSSVRSAVPRRATASAYSWSGVGPERAGPRSSGSAPHPVRGRRTGEPARQGVGAVALPPAFLPGVPGRLEIDRPAALGHSVQRQQHLVEVTHHHRTLGGLVVGHLAHRAPQRLGHVLLVEPGFPAQAGQLERQPAPPHGGTRHLGHPRLLSSRRGRSHTTPPRPPARCETTGWLPRGTAQTTRVARLRLVEAKFRFYITTDIWSAEPKIALELTRPLASTPLQAGRRA